MMYVGGGACGGQKVLDPQKLEFLVVVSHWMWIL